MSEDRILALVMGMGAAAIIGCLVLYVLLVIANWKIFTKAGEKGWKSIIPIYNVYILYKISWKVSMFWISLALIVLYSIFAALAQDGNTFFLILALIAIIAVAVIEIMQLHKLSKSYGHGAGFTVGLVLLNTIFMLILGLGSSQYIGNTTTSEQQ